MVEGKPVRAWARVGAGFVVACSAVALGGMLVLMIAGRGVPAWSWAEWLVYGWCGYQTLPLFAYVAVKGRTPHGQTRLPGR